jgi:hypothetical protein
MSEKNNINKKCLPDWLSAIWFFGIVSTLIFNVIIILPNLKELQWTIGHGLFILFIPGSIAFIFWIIVIPILYFTQKYKFTKFNLYQFFIYMLIVVIALLKEFT